jgi:hypothetical protein
MVHTCHCGNNSEVTGSQGKNTKLFIMKPRYDHELFTTTKTTDSLLNAITQKYLSNVTFFNSYLFFANISLLLDRVARFFLVQNSKTGKNIPNYHKKYQRP